MGGGASTGVRAAVGAASAGDLRAALAGLPEDARLKLKAALTERTCPASSPSACEVLRKIHSGEKTCAAFVAELLDRIQAVDGPINSCVAVADRAALLAQAAEVDAKVAAGQPLRALEGLPMVVKLNIDTRGMLTSASTLALKDHVPAKSAPAWQRLEDAGALCIAKTNMPELACAVNGYSPLHGHCWNPHAPGFSAGGSSSGTAAAIAAGLAPCGLGSDTAGSARLPAEICGCAGMRPSLGRLPGEGCVPLGRQDTVGPMGRTVADLALIDAVMAGEAGAAAKLGPPAAAELTGARACVPAKWVGEIAAGTRAALDLAIAALEKGGAAVDRLQEDDAAFAALDARLEGASHCKMGLGPSLPRRMLEKYLASHAGLDVTVDTLVEKVHWTQAALPPMLTSAEAKESAALSEEEFEKVMAPFNAEKAELEAALEKYFSDTGTSFILTPCTKGPPINNALGDMAFAKLEAAAAAAKESGDVPARMKAFATLYMPPISHVYRKMLDLAVPSIAVPTSARHDVGGASLPAGVLIWGPPRSDRRLLEFGIALEEQLAKM